MNFIERYRKIIQCRMFGHMRGKRTGVSSSLGVQFQCPRCEAVWNRKQAKEKAK